VSTSWQDQPLAAPGELNAAVQELLEYTQDVEAGRRERVNQVPLTMDPEMKLRIDSGGLTAWRGVLAMVPHLALFGALVIVFAQEAGAGEWVLDGTLVVGELFMPLLDAVEGLFGWTAGYGWGLDFPVYDLPTIDLATWSPWLGGLLFALLVAAVVGPTRSAWNQLLVMRDQLRR